MENKWSQPIPLPGFESAHTNGYNLDLLPNPLKLAAKEVERFAKVPAASPAIVGLSCIATAISKKAVVVERDGLEHHPAIFFTLIAASGERKSPAFSNMTKPLDKWSMDQQSNYEEKLIEVKTTNEMVDCSIAKVKSNARKPKANMDVLQQDMMAFEQKRLTPPPSPNLYTTDTTEERLFQKMHERNESFAVLTGEGRSALDQILGKYSPGNGTGDGLYLSGITGDKVTRDRMGSNNTPEERVMYKPCLNVCIMIQPDKYLEIARHPSLRDAGTLARIWPVWLPSLVGKRIEHEDEKGLDLSVMDSYSALINALLTNKPPESKQGDATHKAHLSNEAQELRRLFHNQIEEMMAKGNKLDDMRDIASKAVSQTCKMALLLHLADKPELLNQSESFIDKETWIKAEALGKYHLNEAVRIQRKSSEDAEMDMAKRILVWTKQRRPNELTTTDLSQSLPRPRPKADEARSGCDVLANYQYLKKVSNSKYLVNPQLE